MIIITIVIIYFAFGKTLREIVISKKGFKVFSPFFKFVRSPPVIKRDYYAC